jgi:hypothetical protein
MLAVRAALQAAYELMRVAPVDFPTLLALSIVGEYLALRSALHYQLALDAFAMLSVGG